QHGVFAGAHLVLDIAHVAEPIDGGMAVCLALRRRGRRAWAHGPFRNLARPRAARPEDGSDRLDRVTWLRLFARGLRQGETLRQDDHEQRRAYDCTLHLPLPPLNRWTNEISCAHRRGTVGSQ